MEPPQVPHIVLVGGGFAGLYAAYDLAGAKARVTLLDRRNHHLFQPLLYQVATAGLSAPDIARPLRELLAGQENLQVLLAEVVAVRPEARQLELTEGTLGYDFLILATGAGHAYFGHDEWIPHAPGLKTLDDALEIRRRVLLAYEAAEREPDAGARAALLTFVVVGAGPTGVELAGALAEIAHHAMARNFRNFDPDAARVVLVEGGPRVLASFHEDLSAPARRQLEELGVEVRLAAPVTGVDARGVALANGERLEARTVLWGAGIAASPLGATLGVPRDRAGRVLVEPDLSVPGHPEVFVVGDLAHFEQDGCLVPGVAPAAIQGGQHAARQVLRRLRGLETEPFHYRDKGSMATIGRRRGVAQLGRWRFSGLLAWLSWMGVHIFFLIGFPNRIKVMLEWAWAYLTYRRGSRLIFEGGAGARCEPCSR